MEHKKNWQDKIVDALMLRKLPVTNVPSYMYNISYWTGSIALSALLWEFITGPLLLLYYNVAHPYTSTQFIINSVPFGSVILFTHTYGAYIMIVALYIHAMRHFLVGAYKKPRQWVWVIGVVLFLLTLGVSFFGYNLIGDALSYDARDVAIGMASGVPLGGAISSLLFGLGTTAQIFSRLLGLHIILALSILVVFIVHFLLFEKSGATPSIKKAPTAPAINSEEERKALGSWWPQIFLYTMAIVLITWAIIMIIPNAIVQINNLPSLISPFPGPSPTSAAAASAVPYPPWFLLPVYKIADFLLPNGSPFTPLINVGLIAVVSLVMLALPFIDRSKYRSPIKRKFWTALAFAFISWLIVLTVWGAISPGVQITTNIQLLNLLPP
ncbi:MAG: cytochrome b, partial [Candidatus Parvarchaeum sp.]